MGILEFLLEAYINSPTTELSTKTKVRKYNDGSSGYKVIFYDGDTRIGEAATANFEGKENNFLHGVEVKSKLRGKGYGNKIVKYMIDKYNVDSLYVESTNKVAISLYKKFGFKIRESFNSDGAKFHIMIRKR